MTPWISQNDTASTSSESIDLTIRGRSSGSFQFDIDVVKRESRDPVNYEVRGGEFSRTTTSTISTQYSETGNMRQRMPVRPDWTVSNCLAYPNCSGSREDSLSGLVLPPPCDVNFHRLSEQERRQAFDLDVSIALFPFQNASQESAPRIVPDFKDVAPEVWETFTSQFPVDGLSNYSWSTAKENVCSGTTCSQNVLFSTSQKPVSRFLGCILEERYQQAVRRSGDTPRPIEYKLNPHVASSHQTEIILGRDGVPAIDEMGFPLVADYDALILLVRKNYRQSQAVKFVRAPNGRWTEIIL